MDPDETETAQPVRAKFVVQGTTGYNGVILTPVMGDTEENKAFWDATPNGSITLYITNPEAFARFQVGEQMYVDFTPAQ